MYLSVFVLDRSVSSARQCLVNSHDMHRTVMSCFKQIEGENPRQTAGVLYKLITTTRDIKLYVTSKVEPACGKIESQGFHKIGMKNITQIKENLNLGSLYSFDLLASPSKKEAREGKLSRRVPLKTMQERFA